jgi:PRTRC genetic system protein E
MFKELAPYLRQRAVLLTVTHLEDEQIRVNIVPQKLKDGENAALTTPLTVTGSAEELDQALPTTVINFVSAHLELKNTLDRAQAEMDAAAKAAQGEARKKSKTAGTTVEPNRTIANEKPDRPVSPKPEPPKVASLFDPAPEPAADKGEPGPSSKAVSGLSEDDQAVLDEIREERDAEESFTSDGMDDTHRSDLDHLRDLH